MTKILTTAAFAVASITMFSVPAQAETELNPWADCGLGAMLFPKKEHEVGAIVSNLIWDLGTTAVTSAASSKDSCSGADDMDVAILIERTFSTLETEIAKGEGENLSAMVALTGVENEDAFVAALRADYAEIVADGSASPETLYFATKAAADSLG